jgi:hypothetical protein
VEFADRFGATVDVSTTAAGVGLFLVFRWPWVDHAVFRRTVATAVGGPEYVRLDAPGGYLVVATAYETAQALRGHPVVDHVGGVTVDPARLPTPTVERLDETESHQ